MYYWEGRWREESWYATLNGFWHLWGTFICRTFSGESPDPLNLTSLRRNSKFWLQVLQIFAFSFYWSRIFRSVLRNTYGRMQTNFLEMGDELLTTLGLCGIHAHSCLVRSRVLSLVLLLSLITQNLLLFIPFQCRVLPFDFCAFLRSCLSFYFLS